METAELGLRERKKVATRRALHEAAVRLAMEEGLDKLTVEAIADAATVSRRTFSNYFASKEDALLYGDRERVAALLRAVRARPRSEPPWTALTAATRERLAEPGGFGPEWVARARFIRSHDSLLAQQIAVFASFERDLVAELLSRMPPGERPGTRARLMAACYLASLRVAMESWLDRPEGSSAAEVAGEVLGQAGAGFA
ncbi:TetR family transcriptional regulator [Prauserella sp. PE36]|uniref:TetR family transcriptional regulator n=1 Tax=Prauserella endophytica TaxID=1592324 RepID=A0ABY2S841_9PSEU|nr:MULTISPECIES: TetR/AcrR family transcriptional regulator [Prauserella]RBM22700.1 TetR family transcriptional regulator [Prauserella sp. PE36]TKG72055.1 TetR family transcriptional regulator [Prauserella endophytica]